MGLSSNGIPFWRVFIWMLVPMAACVTSAKTFGNGSIHCSYAPEWPSVLARLPSNCQLFPVSTHASKSSLTSAWGSRPCDNNHGYLSTPRSCGLTSHRHWSHTICWLLLFHTGVTTPSSMRAQMTPKHR